MKDVPTLRRSDQALLTGTPLPAGAGLRYSCRSRVELAGLPALDQDELWSHPLVAGAVDARLRADLRTLGGRARAARPHGRPAPGAAPRRRQPQNASATWPATFRERAALTRFIADLGLSLP
jgi:hypothetical protein